MENISITCALSHVCRSGTGHLPCQSTICSQSQTHRVRLNWAVEGNAAVGKNSHRVKCSHFRQHKIIDQAFVLTNVSLKNGVKHTVTQETPWLHLWPRFLMFSSIFFDLCFSWWPTVSLLFSFCEALPTIWNVIFSWSRFRSRGNSRNYFRLQRCPRNSGGDFIFNKVLCFSAQPPCWRRW